jgi:hypothetical protein
LAGAFPLTSAEGVTTARGGKAFPYIAPPAARLGAGGKFEFESGRDGPDDGSAGSECAEAAGAAAAARGRGADEKDSARGALLPGALLFLVVAVAAIFFGLLVLLLLLLKLPPLTSLEAPGKVVFRLPDSTEDSVSDSPRACAADRETVSRSSVGPYSLSLAA